MPFKSSRERRNRLVGFAGEPFFIEQPIELAEEKSEGPLLSPSPFVCPLFE